MNKFIPYKKRIQLFILSYNCFDVNKKLIVKL